MADETEKKEESSTLPAKKSSKKMIIIIGAVLVLIGVGAGGFILFGSKGDASVDSAAAEKVVKPKEEAKHGEGHGEADAEKMPTEVIALDPFVVNLSGRSVNRYLKLTINLEVDSALAEEVKAQNARLRDSIIILLSSKSYADIGTAQGKYQLRDEIALRVNHILNGGKVKGIYFTEFVVQ